MKGGSSAAHSIGVTGHAVDVRVPGSAQDSEGCLDAPAQPATWLNIVLVHVHVISLARPKTTDFLLVINGERIDELRSLDDKLKGWRDGEDDVGFIRGLELEGLWLS